MAKYRKYSKEFKLQAARLVTEQGYSDIRRLVVEDLFAIERSIQQRQIHLNHASSFWGAL